jgi:hypothetical protein
MKKSLDGMIILQRSENLNSDPDVFQTAKWNNIGTLSENYNDSLINN